MKRETEDQVMQRIAEAAIEARRALGIRGSAKPTQVQAPTRRAGASVHTSASGGAWIATEARPDGDGAVGTGPTHSAALRACLDGMWSRDMPDRPAPTLPALVAHFEACGYAPIEYRLNHRADGVA